jgi:hypothetical protein
LLKHLLSLKLTKTGAPSRHGRNSGDDDMGPDLEYEFCQFMLRAKPAPDPRTLRRDQEKLNSWLNQMQEHAERIFLTVCLFELESPVSEERDDVASQIATVKMAILEYRQQLRKYGRAQRKAGTVDTVWRRYRGVISAGHDFCALVFPHLTSVYEERLGTEAG